MKLRLGRFAHPAPVLGLIALSIIAATVPARAALITNSTNLPPDGVYLGPDIHQIYGGPALAFLLTLPAHAPIAAEVGKRAGGNGSPGDPNDEIETFGSTLTAMLDVQMNGMSITGGPQPITASGPFGSVETLVSDRLLSVDGTGSFDTEMLQLNLAGVSPLGPFMIRESPTLQSTGHTTITDIGGGLYQIDSFFDVFTELSIDGGMTWMPGSDTVGGPAAPGHVTLEAVPEPGTLLWGAALGIFAGVRRARSRRA